jgi:UDP-N-acetylmuramoyl-tripeptide--D-alanyl-D-alanine ligase
MNIEELYKLFLANPSVKTDTRHIVEGDIFFALKGPNFNGNNYAEKAVEAGASYCICDEKSSFINKKIIYVDDVLKTLQELAKHHRMQFKIPFIAITGSNGKTTTKELCHAVISSTFKCYTTKGNLNNHIGIPLTILSVKQDAEMAIIEMGANHLHEIESYCAYTMPTHGLITNCGKAHLEGFGSEAGVRKGKGELYDYLEKNNGIVFLNTDHSYLIQMSKKIKNIITYGKNATAEYSGNIITGDPYINIEITNGAKGLIKTKIAGRYNFDNVMAAVCMGKVFGVSNKNIISAIEDYSPDNSRSQIINKGSNTILLDAYNANPSSMKEAIENFAAMQNNGKSKIIVLGEMKEMGTASEYEHKTIIDTLLKHKWDKVILTGQEFKNLPYHFIHFNTTKETADWFNQQQYQNSLILIKGSRGMAMENIMVE